MTARDLFFDRHFGQAFLGLLLQRSHSRVGQLRRDVVLARAENLFHDFRRLVLHQPHKLIFVGLPQIQSFAGQLLLGNLLHTLGVVGQVLTIACAASLFNRVNQNRLDVAHHAGCQITLCGGVHARAKLLDCGVDRVLANSVKGFGVDNAAAAGPLCHIVSHILDRTKQNVVTGKLWIVCN